MAARLEAIKRPGTGHYLAMRAWIWAVVFLVFGIGAQPFVDQNWGPVLLLAGVAMTVVLALTTPQVRRLTAVTIVRVPELKRLRRLAEEQEQKKDWDGGLRRLGELRGEGVELRRRGDKVHKREDVKAFIADADAWGTLTGDAIDALSPTDAALFRVIDRFRFPQTVHGARTVEHNTASAVLNERLGMRSSSWRGTASASDRSSRGPA